MKKFTAIILALVLMFSMSAMSLTAAGGSTTVNISIDATQISVTVPIEFTIGAVVDGGTATVPDNYGITNNSLIPVKVDTIAVTLKEGATWAFKSAEIAANTAPTANGTNDIYLSVNGLVLTAHAAAEPTNKTAWNISAGATKNLVLACSTSRLNTTDAVSNLITITYVISAGSHS